MGSIPLGQLGAKLPAARIKLRGAASSVLLEDLLTQPVDSPRIIASRARTMGAQTDGGGGANNYTRSISRFKVTVGRSGAADIRLVFTNWKIQGNNLGEAAGANPITVEAAIETTTGTPFYLPVHFNGAASVVLAPGATVESDPVPLSFAAAEAFFIRTGVTVSSGQTWPRGFTWNQTGENVVENTSPNSQVMATGALVADGGVASVSHGYGPAAIVGIQADFMPSLLVFGDSIAEGVGETVSPFGGFISRGLSAAAAATGQAIPHTTMARSGNALVGSVGALGQRQRGLFKYVSQALIELGTNDIPPAASRSLAQLQADFTDIVKALRARRVSKIYATTLMPRTTSTDSWATAANQSFVSGFAPGGVRDQYNAWIRGNAGGLIDGFVDSGATVEDPANPGKWRTNGTANYPTTDGTHPSSAMHIIASQAIDAWARTL